MTSRGELRQVDHQFVASVEIGRGQRALGARGDGGEHGGAAGWTKWSPEARRRPWRGGEAAAHGGATVQSERGREEKAQEEQELTRSTRRGRGGRGGRTATRWCSDGGGRRRRKTGTVPAIAGLPARFLARGGRGGRGGARGGVGWLGAAGVDGEVRRPEAAAAAELELGLGFAGEERGAGERGSRGVHGRPPYPRGEGGAGSEASRGATRRRRHGASASHCGDREDGTFCENPLAHF